MSESSFCRLCGISFEGSHCPLCDAIPYSVDEGTIRSWDPSIHLFAPEEERERANRNLEAKFKERETSILHPKIEWTTPPKDVTQQLNDNIDGVWWNEDRQVIICIDTSANSYRSWHPKRKNTKQLDIHFTLKGNNPTNAFLWCDNLKIELHASEAGLLLMETHGLTLGFWNLSNAQPLKLCPRCFNRTNISNNSCSKCRHKYGKIYPKLAPIDPVIELAQKWAQEITK